LIYQPFDKLISVLHHSNTLTTINQSSQK